ncbi:MAG: TonB-dependent receptor domain-containing protein [Pyrinomonadaceae bacterium]
MLFLIMLSNFLYSQSIPSLKPQEREIGALEIDVFDQSGSAIFPISISLTSENGLQIETKTFAQDSKIEFSALRIGNYWVSVEAAGFDSQKILVEIKEGKNYIKIILAVSPIKERVEISREDTAQRSVVNVFDQTLSSDEIDALPDNPQQIGEVLKAKYGDDIVIEVDGFTEMNMPSKDQIESILVLRSSFDVEFHEVGKTVVKIRTKIPDKVRWSGFLNLNFGNQFLNARNAFEQKKTPNNERFFVGFLNGPFFIKRSMFSIGLTNIATSRINPVNANSEQAINLEDNRTTMNLVVPTLMLRGTLENGATYTGMFSFLESKVDGVGVGGINLPERGFAIAIREPRFRFSFSSVFENGILNETLIETFRRSTNIIPRSIESAIVVRESFSSGGASVDRDSMEYGFRGENKSNFIWKNNQIKIGAKLELDKYNGRISDNLNGTFIFLNLNDFRQNRPIYFRQRREITKINADQASLAWYVQDHISISDRLAVTLGLRYEIQNLLYDSNNFSPRLSIVASADKDSRLVFRVGAGIFYPWFELNDYVNISAGVTNPECSILFPSFPDPMSSISLSVRNENRKTIDPKLKNPETYILQGSANFRINKMFELESTYRFTRFIHMYRSRDLNFPVAFIKPMPLVGNIAQFESSGSGVENSFETSLQSYLPHGISANIRYKLAKNISNYKDKILELPANSSDLRSEFGDSDLDRRHSFNGSFSLSIFKFMSVISTFKYESPLPFTIITGKDENLDGIINDRPIGEQRNSARGGWLKRHDLIAKVRVPLTRERKNNTTAGDNENSFSMGKSIGIEIAIRNVLNQNSKLNYIGNQLSPYYLMPTSSAPSRAVTIGISYFF